MKRVLLIAVILTMSFSLLAGVQQKHPLRQVMFNVPRPNVGVAEIDHPENFSRIVAISDVHGMWRNLYALLLSTHLIDAQLHWRGGKTLLIVDGDSIDEGPDSLYVLDFWIHLLPQARAAGGDVLHLLGDHEAQFLADPNNPNAATFRAELAAKQVPLQEITDPAFPRGAFLRSLPLAARVGRWLFCHSGLYPKLDWANFVGQSRLALTNGNYANPLVLGDDSVLVAKNWWVDLNTKKALELRLTANNIYGVVFGHDPNAFNVRDEVAVMDQRLVKIDAGMSPEGGAYPGHLLVFTRPADLNVLQPPQLFSMSVFGVLRPLY